MRRYTAPASAEPLPLRLPHALCFRLLFSSRQVCLVGPRRSKSDRRTAAIPARAPLVRLSPPTLSLDRFRRCLAPGRSLECTQSLAAVASALAESACPAGYGRERRR